MHGLPGWPRHSHHGYGDSDRRRDLQHHSVSSRRRHLEPGACGRAQLHHLKASQTITLASITNKVYGTAPLDIIATASSGLPVTVTASGKCTVAPGDELGDDGDDFDVTLTGAGLCTVRATQAGSANYNSAFSVTRTFSVTRAPLSITAENDTRVYKQANPLIGYVAAGFVPGETIANLSGTLTCSASALSNSAVGTYSTSCSGVYSSNYNITFVKGVFTVTKATQTITFAAIPAKTYGDASFTVSPTSDSGLFVTVAVTSRALHRFARLLFRSDQHPRRRVLRSHRDSGGQCQLPGRHTGRTDVRGEPEGSDGHRPEQDHRRGAESAPVHGDLQRLRDWRERGEPRRRPLLRRLRLLRAGCARHQPGDHPGFIHHSLLGSDVHQLHDTYLDGTLTVNDLP